MKASELRVDNLVNYEGRVCEVITISQNGDLELAYLDRPPSDPFILTELDILEIEPIPLTEDWLIKLGFDKERNAHDTTDLYIHDIISLSNKGDYFSCAIHTLLTYPLPTKIKNVHQLQNLYFALTGEELTLTEQ